MIPLCEKEALQFAHNLIRIYFSDRDMDKVITLMNDQISCIGTGEIEYNFGISKTKEALKRELLEFQGTFEISEADLSFVSINESSGIIFGIIKAIPSDPSFEKEEVRASAILKKVDRQIQIMHVHFSHADLIQGEDQYFVKHDDRISHMFLRNHLLNLTKNIPGGMHQCKVDDDLTLLSMSESFIAMFGYTREEIVALFENKYMNMIYEKDRGYLRKEVEKQNVELELEYRVRCKNGNFMWVLDKGRKVESDNGTACYYCMLVDVTKRKRQEEELRLSLERHQVIMNQANDIIFEWDICKDNLILSSNWKKRFGFEPISNSVFVKIPKSNNIHEKDMVHLTKLMKDVSSGTPYCESEIRIRNKDGKYTWCLVRATTQLDDEGKAIKAVGVIVDIDKEKKQKQHLIKQAQFDTLTGIYNKASIDAFVGQRMKDINSSGYQALFIIDVDFFKFVNDTYGHLIGDTVLSDVAAALKGCIRASDLVGRIGGDEFLVYLSNIESEKIALAKAESMVQQIRKIKPITGAPSITCSIGLVIQPYGSENYEQLYRCADQALYERKSKGRNGITLYQKKCEEERETRVREFTAVGRTIVSDEEYVNDELLSQYVFRTLYESMDIEVDLRHLLEIIGRSLDVSRVYIIEKQNDGCYFRNTFEWCAEGVISRKDNLHDISYEHTLHGLPSYYDENGSFCCSHMDENKTITMKLKTEDTYSMLHCAILDGNEFEGCIGYDECRIPRSWNDKQIAMFKLTANVLSTFLIKHRQKEKYEKLLKECAR